MYRTVCEHDITWIPNTCLFARMLCSCLFAICTVDCRPWDGSCVGEHAVFAANVRVLARVLRYENESWNNCTVALSKASACRRQPIRTCHPSEFEQRQVLL